MERCGSAGEERWIGDFVEVGRAGEDALGFFAPVFGVAGIFEFGLDGGKSLQEELAIVGKGESVLAGDAAGDLMKKDFAERDIDGGRGLKIADGRENVRGDDVSVSDAAHFEIEMMMAKRSVAGIVGGGAALAVSAKMLAAALWGVVRSWRGGRCWRASGTCCADRCCCGSG